MKAFFIPLFFLPLFCVSLGAQVSESKTSSAEMDIKKVGDWMANQGQSIRQKATNRLVQKSEEPEFVRKELIDLYINTRVELESLNQLYAYVALNSDPVFFIDWGKLNRKEASEMEERAIRLLDILSKMPPPKAK